MTPEQLAVLSDSLEAAGVSQEDIYLVGQCVEIALTVQTRRRMWLVPAEGSGMNRMWRLIQMRDDDTRAQNADATMGEWIQLAAHILRLQ